MFAALPWYDLPELRPQLRAFWAGWARHAEPPRVQLQHEAPLYEPLSRTDLLITQTCGLVAGRPEFPAAVVATPCFEARPTSRPSTARPGACSSATAPSCAGAWSRAS